MPSGLALFLALFFGAFVVWQAPHTVHPLLIYTELVLTGSDRAREAASELRERFLASPR